MEVVDALYHHIRFIKNRLDDAEVWDREDIDSVDSATQFVEEIVIPHLAEQEGGLGHYPAAGTGEGRSEFVQAMSEVVYGYCSDNFRSVPEFDSETLKRNFDRICYTCGNVDREVGDCKKSKYYGVIRRL